MSIIDSTPQFLLPKQLEGIAPYTPVWDKSGHVNGTFELANFKFDVKNNCYVYPAGDFLRPAWRSKEKNPYRYRASQYI